VYSQERSWGVRRRFKGGEEKTWTKKKQRRVRLSVKNDKKINWMKGAQTKEEKQRTERKTWRGKKNT